MALRIFQTGWNYSQDGPGNRLLIHFQGCNFDCPWCSNPEGRSAQGELFVQRESLLPEVCPHGAVSASGLDRNLCRACRDRACLGINRNLGIRFSSRSCEVEELVRMAEESRSLFFDGGGVTLTGGEATLQFEDLKKILSRLKTSGIHTALETNGSHKDLKELFPLLDLLILDVKHWDFSKAEAVIHNRGNHVHDNLLAACEAGVNTLARITLIPGFNSSREDMEQFAALFASLPRKENFSLELLFYHEYGRSKWDAIGQCYRGPEGRISDQDKKNYREILESRGLKTVST